MREITLSLSLSSFCEEARVKVREGEWKIPEELVLRLPRNNIFSSLTHSLPPKVQLPNERRFPSLPLLSSTHAMHPRKEKRRRKRRRD